MIDSIDFSRVSDAMTGFVNSVGQTGANMGTSLSHLGMSIHDKLPNQLSQQLSQLSQIVTRKQPPPPPQGILASLSGWLDYHKWGIVGLSLATFAGAVYLGDSWRSFVPSFFIKRHERTYCPEKAYKSRRARRVRSGARCEAVLLVGSPRAPIVRLISEDLDRRGFIVYITAMPGEQSLLDTETNPCIKALKVNSLVSPEDVQAAILRFHTELDTPIARHPGAVPHTMKLTGALIVVDMVYPSGPVETISLAQWTETVEYNIQAPLNFLGGGGVELVREHDSKLVLLTPGIVGPLAMPYYTAEAIVYGALSALALALSRELKSLGVPFTHMRLGSFDTTDVRMSVFNHFTGVNYMGFGTGIGSKRGSTSQEPTIQADIRGWSENMRRLYGRGYRASAHWKIMPATGSPLMSLFFSIYDVLKSGNPPRVCYVGKNSRLYNFLATWCPEGLVDWLARNTS